MRSGHRSPVGRLWFLLGLLVAFNFAVFGLRGTPVIGQTQDVDECVDDSDCYHDCSGQCIQGERVNCFCCAGFCWTCGDPC